MKESSLLKIAFFVSVIGIVLLYLFADSIILEETRLNETDKLQQDKTVRIIGIVKKISTNDNNTFITIEQSNNIDVFVNKPINLTQNSTVEVIGKVDEYNGKKEIVAEKIMVVGTEGKNKQTP